MKTTPLGKLADIKTGKLDVNAGSEDGKYPFFTCATNTYKINNYAFDNEAVLIAGNGDLNVKYYNGKFNAYQRTYVIQNKDKEILFMKYLYYFMETYMDRLRRDSIGGIIKYIKLGHLTEAEIPLPPLDDQIRIAHLLGKVEGLIAQRKQHLQQLDDLLKSVFLEMFGDPVRNEKGWETRKLGDIATVERGRFSPRPRNDPKFYSGVHPFIQTGDISRANGRLKEYTQTLNDLGTKVSKEFKVGTIVIAIVGATIGEAAILEIATYAPDSVIGITPKSEDLTTESVFIEFILRFWKPVLRAKAPEAARANINIETLRPLPIIFPHKDAREKFSRISAKVENLKAIYLHSVNDLENLYGVLSQRAFKGELDLSRVPLKPITANLDAQQAAQTVSASAIVKDQQLAIDLPDVENMLVALVTIEGRQRLVQHWLEAYRAQLKGSAFSVNDFLGAAQVRLSELHPENEFEIGVPEYDALKNWVFELLGNGRLAQVYDDARNRVQVVAAKG